VQVIIYIFEDCDDIDENNDEKKVSLKTMKMKGTKKTNTLRRDACKHGIAVSDSPPQFVKTSAVLQVDGDGTFTHAAFDCGLIISTPINET
jgi:hypothetical protein